jgi:hypothetical protein
MKHYIIWTPSLKLNSGGVTLLHRLGYMINSLGYEAYLWPADNNFETFLTNIKYGNKLAEGNMINNDAIIVYPEIAVGNPLNAKYVVRWLLNKPGKLGGNGVFDKNDMVFYLSDAFVEDERKINYLKISELYGKMFIDRNLDRKGSCYVMRKGKNRKVVHDLNESVEIIDSTPSEELVRLFNEKRFFYCYDDASFLSLQAALCGCISIVIPKDGISAEEWLGYSKTRKYGIAYGEENIEHAIMTMDKVRFHLESLETEFYRNVKNFIVKTQKWSIDEASKNYEDKTSKFLEIGDNVKIVQQTYETEIIKVEKLLGKGNLIKAEKILQMLYDKYPQKIKVINYLTFVAIQKKEFDKAKNLINTALQIDNNNIYAIDNLEYLTEVVYS